MAVFPPLFAPVRDPRVEGKVTYPIECLLFTGVLLFLLRLEARRQIGWVLRKPGAAAKLASLFGVGSAPHGDTLDDLTCRLEVDEVQECICAMVERLIRRKVLYPYRLLDKWFVIAIDGTGTLCFAQRHCPHCLTRTSKSSGKTTFYHNVLEAKIVTRDGFAFSIMTEFIENPHENPTKQDCELKALHRLAARLKQRFPKLPIALSLDGLYACGPVFELCRQNGWRFMSVLKDRDLPSVTEEFESLAPLTPKNRLALHTGKDLSTHQEFTWVNDISFTDTARREHEVSVLQCLETTSRLKKVSADQSSTDAERAAHAAATPTASPTPGPEQMRPAPTRQRRRRGARQAKHLVEVVTTKKHRWITDSKVTEKTAPELANTGGRLRWKVENEGFNVQKNGGFGLEHAYSNDPNSAKVFYLLLQMAHILAQLLDKGSLLRRDFPKGFGSAKNLARALLEAWRNAAVNIPTASRLPRFQIRFDSS